MKLFEKSLCNVMSHFELFAYLIKLNISTKNTVTSYIVISTDLCNAMQSRKYNTGQNFVIGTLKIAKIICKLPLQKALFSIQLRLNLGYCNSRSESTITQKMAAVYFPSNALRSKIFQKANRCLLKGRRKAGGRFVYFAKMSHHLVILCSLYSVIFN